MIKTSKIYFARHADGSKERVRVVYYPLPQSTTKDHEELFYRKHLEPIDRRCMKLSELILPYTQVVSKTYLGISGKEAASRLFSEKELTKFKEYKDEYNYLSKERKILENHAKFNAFISYAIERVSSLFLSAPERFALVENDKKERYEIKAKYLVKKMSFKYPHNTRYRSKLLK